MRLRGIFWKSLPAQSFDAHFSRDYGNALTGPSRRAGTAFDDPAQLAPGPRSREPDPDPEPPRSEEHTSELQSLMRTSYAVFCLKNKTTNYLAVNLHIPSIYR